MNVSARPGRTPHLPGLDGLRAVAVVLVVLYHADLDLFRNGFVGVDVFFVLSGFLITTTLLGGAGAEGRLRLGRFYARRFRRLLPASAIVLVATAIGLRVWATPLRMDESADGLRAAALYFANWHFIGESTDYFARTVEAHPALHFWSLSIEEQFYVGLPLVALVVMRTGGRHAVAVLRALVVIGIVISAGLTLSSVLPGSDHLLAADWTGSRVYFGTDTRVYQPLIGVALALVPAIRDRARIPGAVSVAALLAVVVLSTSVVDVAVATRGLLVAPLAGLVVVALAQGGTPTAALSASPLVALGRISYGVYLWHWPLFILLRERFDPPAAVLLVAGGATTLALAAVSHALVETPVRRSERLDRHHLRVVGASLALSAVLGLVLLPGLLTTSTTTPPPRGPAALGDDGLGSVAWTLVRADQPEFRTCDDAEDCTIVTGGRPSVVLIGDSVANSLVPTLTEITTAEGSSFAALTAPGCPWPRDLSPISAFLQSCVDQRERWYDGLLAELDPDIVVVASRPYDLDARITVGTAGAVYEPDDPDYDTAVADAMATELDDLARPGRTIVVVEPMPTPGFDVLDCLSGGLDPDGCTFDRGPTERPTETHLRTLAAGRDDVVLVDMDDLVCPQGPNCGPVVDDTIVWSDASHITATFARHIAPAFRALLADAGAL